MVFPVRLGYYLGAATFVVTSAAGGLSPGFAAGEIMMHVDYINMAGANPLTGPNDNRLGPRFPVMFDPYDGALRALAARVARSRDLNPA